MLQDDEPTSVNDAASEGYQEGLEAGIETGIQEGSLMAMRAVLLRCLARRGVTDDWVRLKVAEESSPERLTWWIDQVLDLKSPDQLRPLF